MTEAAGGDAWSHGCCSSKQQGDFECLPSAPFTAASLNFTLLPSSQLRNELVVIRRLYHPIIVTCRLSPAPSVSKA